LRSRDFNESHNFSKNFYRDVIRKERIHSNANAFILFWVIMAQANLQDLLSKVNVTAALDIEGNVPLQSVQLDGLVNYFSSDKNWRRWQTIEISSFFLAKHKHRILIILIL